MFEHLREMHREHHEHCHQEGRHRHRFGGFGGRWAGADLGPDHGFGQGRGERLFDGGQLRLVILQLIAEKPSYGYELMKAIEERLSGGYAPSPGVVYPTLTLLEEEGLATVQAAEGNKKLYAATDAGRAVLKENSVILKAIFGRMEQAGKRFGRGRSPQIMRAMMNLKMALGMRTGRGDLNAEQLSKIAEAIDAAARAIDEA
jgi:DNA-binding PadR family transcriptional regulator